MKKSILSVAVIIVFAMWSCTNSTSTSNVSNADSTKTTQTSLQSVNTSELDLKNMNFNGTEPFWSIKFEEDFALYTSPSELNGLKFFYKKSGDKSNPKLTDALVKVSDKEFKILGTMNNADAEITIKTENCSDGMSPDVYTHKITLLIDKKTKYEGCGKK